MRHTYYGDLQGRFDGSGFRLFLRGCLMWLLVIGPLAFSAAYLTFGVDWSEVVAASAGTASRTEFFDMLQRRARQSHAPPWASASSRWRFSIIVALLLFPVFQAMVLRWWMSGLRLRRGDRALAAAHQVDLRRLPALHRVRAAVLALAGASSAWSSFAMSRGAGAR